MISVETVMSHIHNYFIKNIYIGRYEVANGVIVLPFVPKQNQYIKIEGSVLNDGVYKCPLLNPLKNEIFEGTIYALAVPQRFEALVSEIDTWQTDIGSKNLNIYTSESFGGYSYSKPTNSKGTSTASWQDVFSSRLDEWRKIH